MIRRLFVLAALAGLVWLMLHLTGVAHLTDAGETSEPGGPAEATFVLGFALLAAALLGEIAGHLRLPHITGYLIAGIAFGPDLAGLLSPQVLEPLSIFNDMAYAFIGLAAGAELRLTRLRGRLGSMLLLITMTTVVVATGVAAAFFLAVRLLPQGALPVSGAGGLASSVTGLQLVSIAAMVGVIAAARSPSSAIAIINETRAEGPFSETVLGVTLATDVVVICLFSVAFALAELAFAPEQGLDLLFVATLISELGISVLLGAVLGVGMAFYLRSRGPMLHLVILGLCFVVYRCSEILGHYLEQVHQMQVHLEPLLICAAAGFVIQNLSGQGDRLVHVMERAGLPVYAIFFAMAGAALDLPALLTTWAVALVIAGCRLVTMAAGARIATALAGDPPVFRRYCWLGFVTQAGLSLALIGQIEGSFATWGGQLATVLVAVVAINQLLGPVLFKVALDRAGETRTERPRYGGAAGRSSATRLWRRQT